MALPEWASDLSSDARHVLLTIAALLGTGILGLPLQLVETGLAPFALMMSVTLAMQIAVVFLATDLLQRAHAFLAHQRARAPRDRKLPGDAGHEAPGPLLEQLEEEGGADQLASAAAHTTQADLHTMGCLFLPKYLGRAFDLAVLIVFITTLISYSLAGGGAYSSLVGGSPQASIVPYVLGCSCYVIFVEPFMRAFMQALTAAKVVLLVVIIGLCGLVAGETGLRPHESWESASVLQPFLIGTVAIGGIADLMPYMLDERARASAQRITRFRRSVCVGVVACYLLNLLWAGFVLGIVPQRRSDAGPDGISLQDAAQRGEIATIPVTQIINAQFHSKFGWLAQAIVVFICLSVTVSFSAIGLGLKDVLSGFARSLNAALGLSEDDGAGPEGEGEGEGEVSASGQQLFSAAFWMPADGRGRKRLCGRAVELAIILVAFAAVLGVALSNPTGFLLVLGTFVSMALNLAGGVFISLMYVAARQRAGHLPVLVPLNERAGRVLAGFVVVSFNIAVLYDVHQASRSILAEEFAGALTAAATALLVATSVWPVSRYVIFAAQAEPAAEALLAEG